MTEDDDDDIFLANLQLSLNTANPWIEKMVDVEKIAGSFRSAIQDLLVPELKAIHVELKHHGEEFIRIDKRTDLGSINPAWCRAKMLEV